MKRKWQLITKKGRNFENLLISIVGSGLVSAKKGKATPAQLNFSGYMQIAGSRYLYQQEVKRHTVKLVEMLKNNPLLLIKEYQAFERILKKMVDFADSLPTKNFRQLNLVKFLTRWSEHIRCAIRYDYNYNFLNKPIADIIIGALKRTGGRDFFLDFDTLAQAKNLSAIQRERIDLFKLIKKMQTLHLSFTNVKVQAMLRDHLGKYRFMGMYYFRGRPWNKYDIIKRLKEWQKVGWQTEFKKANYFTRVNLASRKLINRYQFTPYEKKIVSLMKIMNFTTNFFDEAHNYFIYKSLPLLNYTAKKIGVTYTELIELGFDELLASLKSGKKIAPSFRKILRQRNKKSAAVILRGETKIYAGPIVDKLYCRQIRETAVKYKNILKGQVASRGWAAGPVIIFKSVADIFRMKRGSVMVAMATVPSFVPAMEKASAIITETGGLLSHAAIVSRELKVPCIVGVDNVTKILKDGDRVEIDATKGIVRKLSN